jgi:hypothetical protein
MNIAFLNHHLKLTHEETSTMFQKSNLILTLVALFSFGIIVSTTNCFLSGTVLQADIFWLPTYI